MKWSPIQSSGLKETISSDQNFILYVLISQCSKRVIWSYISAQHSGNFKISLKCPMYTLILIKFIYIFENSSLRIKFLTLKCQKCFLIWMLLIHNKLETERNFSQLSNYFFKYSSVLLEEKWICPYILSIEKYIKNL